MRNPFVMFVVGAGLLGVALGAQSSPAGRHRTGVRGRVDQAEQLRRRPGDDAEPAGPHDDATNVTLRLLIRNAYQLQDFQITGGPGWLTSDHFDINAKMPDEFRARRRRRPARVRAHCN